MIHAIYLTIIVGVVFFFWVWLNVEWRQHAITRRNWDVSQRLYDQTYAEAITSLERIQRLRRANIALCRIISDRRKSVQLLCAEIHKSLLAAIGVKAAMHSDVVEYEKQFNDPPVG